MNEYKEGALVVVRDVRELFYIVFIDKEIIGVSRVDQGLGREIIFCKIGNPVFINEGGIYFVDAAGRGWESDKGTYNECRLATFSELTAYIVDLTYRNNLS